MTGQDDQHGYRFYQGEVPDAPIPPHKLDKMTTNVLVTWPKYWVTTPYYKWRGLTWFGKLLFPVWLVASVGVWIVAFFFIGVILILTSCENTANWVWSKLPDVHKDGD